MIEINNYYFNSRKDKENNSIKLFWEALRLLEKTKQDTNPENIRNIYDTKMNSRRHLTLKSIIRVKIKTGYWKLVLRCDESVYSEIFLEMK